MENFTIIYLYECSFKSDKTTRHIRVCTDTFGHAAQLAYLVRSGWEDSDSFELYIVHLLESVIVEDSEPAIVEF